MLPSLSAEPESFAAPSPSSDSSDVHASMDHDYYENRVPTPALESHPRVVKRVDEHATQLRMQLNGGLGY